MMQTFGEKSTSNYLVICLEESRKAGSQIQLTDEEGTILGEYAPEKEFDTMILSVPGMEEGNVYYVKTGEEEDEIQVTIAGRETIFGASPDGRERRGHEPGKWRDPQGGFGRREGEGEGGEAGKDLESKKPPGDFQGSNEKREGGKPRENEPGETERRHRREEPPVLSLPIS